MSRAAILAAASALALATPALAQHAGHAMPAAPAPPAPPPAPAACAPEHAAMGHCAPAPQSAAPDPHAGHAESAPQVPEPQAPAPADPACPPEHAAMGHCTPAPQAPAPGPHAGHDMSAPAASPAPAPASAADPACPPEHAAMGHCTPATQPQTSDPHAGHAMPGAPTMSAPPVAPPPPEALQGPEHAAATVFDPQLFERKRREELIAEHGGYVTWFFMADQLEYRVQDGRDGYKWDLQGWYGGDYDKLWLKSEGEGTFGESPEQAEVQALYSRAIDPWFNVQVGVRHDFRPDPERTHLVVGVQGLARYWFEVDGALFLSNKGDLTARFEAEYDQRITNKLILQPAVEFNLAAQDVPEIGIGSGLSSLEAGLRLRYEFVPEFAPYVGVEYERAFGDTADLRRAAGEDVGGWNLVAGIRLWF